MEDTINGLVDFNDDRFDYRKNWLVQSIRMNSGPAMPQNDDEQALRTHIRSLAPDTQNEVLRRGAAGDKNLNASVSQRSELFARYRHHINNYVIDPSRTDEDNIRSYQKVENEARAIARAVIEADQDTVRIAGKGSDVELAGFRRDVRPPSSEKRQLMEAWNAKRLQRLEDYSKISARDVARYVVTTRSKKAQKARKNGKKRDKKKAKAAAEKRESHAAEPGKSPLRSLRTSITSTMSWVISLLTEPNKPSTVASPTN